jgi:hypothetical protein
VLIEYARLDKCVGLRISFADSPEEQTHELTKSNQTGKKETKNENDKTNIPRRRVDKFHRRVRLRPRKRQCLELSSVTTI